MTDLAAYRVYEPDELLKDGYPVAWHARLKHEVREAAGHRCVRCGHPYRSGEHGTGEWSPCDERCGHAGARRWLNRMGEWTIVPLNLDEGCRLEAQWRILTVHHLDGNKANCRWWNLAPLCQRDHLYVQGRVQMPRVWPWPHTDWFKPYVAGYYAWTCLREDLTRAETEARLDELLGLELVVS